MAIRVECPQCGSTFTVPDSRAGQSGRCKCGGTVTVPAAPAAAADEPALAQMAEHIAEARSRGPAPAAQATDPNQQLCRHCGMATRKDIASCEWCGQALVERPAGFDAGGGYQGVVPSPPVVVYVVRVVAIINAVLSVIAGVGLAAVMLLAGAALSSLGGRPGMPAMAGGGVLVAVALALGLFLVAIGALWWWVNSAVGRAQSAGWWAYTVLGMLAALRCLLGVVSMAVSSGSSALAGMPGAAAGPMSMYMARAHAIQGISLLIAGIHIPILIFWFMRPVREWFGISQPR